MVNCVTQEDANIFIDYCKLKSIFNLLQNFWETYEENTCYNMKYGGAFCNIDFFKGENIKIVRFDKSLLPRYKSAYFQPEKHMEDFIEGKLVVNCVTQEDIDAFENYIGKYNADLSCSWGVHQQDKSYGFICGVLHNNIDYKNIKIVIFNKSLLPLEKKEGIEEINSYYPEIAKMLGLEIGEEFEVNESNYVFRDSGLFIIQIDNSEIVASPVFLMDLLSQKTKPIKIPWKPKCGDTYYVPSIDSKELYSQFTNLETTFDLRLIERNLHCKTKEEAIEKAKKMLKTIIHRFKI
jgi:hypothetical protein